MHKKHYRPNTRKIYEEHYGITLDKTEQVHHILPVRLGGTHDIDNLAVLTKDEHAKAHMELYEDYGDWRDLSAHHMILGHSEESRRLACSSGGKAAQKTRRERGEPVIFETFSTEERKAVASLGGKKGGKRCKELKRGIHAQSTEDRKRFGYMSGMKAVEERGWADPDKQSERGKKGGVKNKGFKWYNDGEKTYKYTTEQQKLKSFEEFISDTGLIAGNIPHYIDEKCPHCGDDKILFMNRNRHFDNCKSNLSNLPPT